MGVGDTWAGAARGWLEDKVKTVYPMLHLKLCITGCISGTELRVNVRAPINVITMQTH